MEYNIPIKEGGLYKAILMVMDPFLELTSSERQVLSEILKLESRVLNSTNRAILKETTGLNKFSLNNHIKKLKDKGILVHTKYRELVVNQNVQNMVSEPKLVINFINKPINVQ